MTSMPQTVTADELAKLLGVTSRTVGNLVADGVIIRVARGQFALAASIQAIVADAKKSRTSSELQREQAAMLAAKRLAIEHRNALAMKELMYTAEAIEVVDEAYATLQAEVNAIPARFTRDPAERKKLQALIDNSFDKTCEYFDKKARKLKGNSN